MRIKSILTAALLLFVVAAVAVVVARETGGRAPLETPEAASAPASPIVEGEAREISVVDASVTSDPPVVETAAQVVDDPPEPVAKAPSEPAVAMQTVDEAVTAPAVTPTPEPAKKRRVLAYYFHGNVRCTTCRTIEAYAREAVEQGFEDDVAAGVLVFMPVNVEEPENRHFIADFQLMTRTVVVAEEIDGTIGRWSKLDEVWQLVSRHDDYLDFVRGVVDDYLEQG